MKTLLSKRAWLRWLAAILIALLVSAGFHVWQVRLPAIVLRHQEIDVDGIRREYRLVVPDALNGRTPAPLVLAFHGAHETPEQMAQNTQLDRLAVAEGFYLVYPQGRRLSWPSLSPDEDPEYIEPDLKFFDRLCERLSEQHVIDGNRIYAVGVSQGGAFVNLLAATQCERLAAVASHSGWLPDALTKQPAAQHKCPVMLIAGSEDRQVPAADVERAAEWFRRGGHRVEMIVVDGLGHRWAAEYGINRQIWEFLSRHAQDEDSTVGPPE